MSNLCQTGSVTQARQHISPHRSAGFSLIEALIVLLVAGMALMLVFSIGGESARTGFRLGRRALAAAVPALLGFRQRPSAAAAVAPAEPPAAGRQ